MVHSRDPFLSHYEDPMSCKRESERNFYPAIAGLLKHTDLRSFGFDLDCYLLFWEKIRINFTLGRLPILPGHEPKCQKVKHRPHPPSKTSLFSIDKLISPLDLIERALSIVWRSLYLPQKDQFPCGDKVVSL